MTTKAAVSLTTGLEDPEKVTVAFLAAAAETGRPTLVFLTREAVRLAIGHVVTGVACEGCPPLPRLVKRFHDAGGRYYVCPICFDARKLDKGDLVPKRRARRDRPAVGMDRRRRRHHVQLLTRFQR
jgi:predicted peroxiredoxin